MKKILHPDVNVLDLNKNVGKSWHPIYHVSLLKKCHCGVNDFHLWQEDPRPPSEYEMWGGMVGKMMVILYSRQIHRRDKQYKCLIHNYSSYEYKLINEVNLPYARTFIKAFEA